MCGRFTQTADIKTLQARFGFSQPSFELTPRYNIAPTQDAPVIIDQDGRHLELFRWGLIPGWSQDAAIGNKMINARAETVAEKPSFARPFKKSRCLIVSDSFYEWRKESGGKLKTPMRIMLKSKEPFAMAGLWDTWRDPAGKVIRSFTIITTEAAPELRSIHDRMPVILPLAAEGVWLDPASKPEVLRQLLLPYDDRLLTAYPVSPIVNSPANDTPACVTPAG